MQRDRERGEVFGKSRVPGVNENGECLVELCEERSMIIGNTWFERKLINKSSLERKEPDICDGAQGCSCRYI